MSHHDGYSNAEALVSTEWLAEHLGEPGYRLIEVDVNPAAYDGGHIEGAVGWDWKRDLQDATVRDIASREALEQKLVNGGRVKWEAEGRPYTTEAPRFQRTDYRFPGQTREELRAYRDQVLERI